MEEKHIFSCSVRGATFMMLQVKFKIQNEIYIFAHFMQSFEALFAQILCSQLENVYWDI